MNSKKYSDLLLDQAKDLIWMVDHKLHLIYANKSYLNLMKEIIGVEKELNTSILQGGLGEGYIEKWEAYYQRALSGDSFTIEEQFFHPFNNEKQYGQISFLPIKDEDGNVQSVACRNTDVTSIVQENYQARLLMEASLDVFCTIDEGGNFVYVSEEAKSHWGYTAEELLNTPYVRLVLEEDIGKTNQATEAIIAGQEVKPFVNRYKRKDGSIAYNLWSARCDRDSKLMYCVVKDARETVEQKRPLEQNENRFKALVQEGSDLIGILDLDGNYTYVSPTSTSIFGIAPENFIGKNAFDFIHPDDREKTLQFLQKIIEEKIVKVEPFRFQNGKGEWRWVETVLTNMLDNIDVKGIVANSRDVTDKIDTKKQLEANELFNRTLLESSPDCLKVIDAEGRIQYMNLNGLCLMEIDDFSKFKNKEWWTLWGKDNELMIKNAVEKALLGETVEFTAFCPTAKGSPKWWNVLVSPIKKTGENGKELLSVSRDITKKKEEEQKLKLLSSVITSANDAVLITEAEPFDEAGHRIIYVNEAFTKMTGYTAEEVIGKTPRILQGPHSDLEALSRLGRALRNWEEYEITTVNYKKNGDEFWVHFNVTPIADESGRYTHWIAIERDITEQKNKELELALLAEISKNFSEEDRLEDACKNVCESIQAFGKFDLVEIWCVNLERSHLQLFSRTHIHNTATINDNSIQKFVEGKGLLGKVWQLKDRQIWDKETMNDLFLRTELRKQLQLNSVAGIPLLFQDEVIGVLVLGSNQDSRFLEKYSNIIQRLESFVASEINRKKLEGDLKHLYDAIPDIVGIADIQCRFLKINKSGSELLGFSKEELHKNSLKDIIFPEDLFKLSEVLQSFQNGTINQSFEARFLSKTSHFIVLNVQCVFNPQEELIYISAKDITEENKLRNLNTQTNKIAKIGSWEVDFEQDKAFWSDMVHQLHETDSKNFSPDLAMSLNFYREDFRPMITNLISKSIEDGSDFDYEAVIVTNNKRERWVRVIGKVERFNGVAKRISGSFQDIHDKKVVEKQLVQALNDKNRILERITEAFVALDSNWCYTYMNKKAGEIFNRNPQEMIGKHIWTEFPEGLNQPFHLAYERAMETQKYVHVEEYYEPYDLWFENHIYPSSNGLSIFFRDITEKKRSEEQLTKAYQEKNNILESIGDAFFTVSNDWIVTYWNKQAEKFLGLAKESILGKNLWEAYSDAIDSDFYRQYHYAMETGETVRFEEKYETLGKWFEVNAYPSATGLSIYFTDVTLRKEADERLIQANERFEKVTEATNDAIWDWDIANDQFYRSDNIHKFFGKTTSKELKKEQFWQEKFHPDDIQKLKESIERSIIDPKINRWEAEYRVIDDNENIVYVIDRGLIIRKNKGKAIRMIGAMTDVSESKRQEEKLLEINQKLEAQTKELQRSNEELEQFAFITSHDLQEPLRMITSFMDQLKRKYADQLDDKALQYIHYATDGAKRMKQIILDLLLYSRANSPTEQKEPIKLNEILSEFLLLRRKLIEEKNAIISYDDLPVLVTYKAAVTQIFHCLLDNALKYSKENMPLIIDVSVREKGDFYEFAIKDNGIGIDERFYEKIFIIFQRLHNRKDYDGTGIGLSVTKRSVEFLGGEIRLESTVGEGTTFYFTILKTKN